MALIHPAHSRHEKASLVRPDPRWILISGGAAVFLAVIVAGYGFGWSWTGFRSNDTLWDWLKLFLVPFAVPDLIAWVSTKRHHGAT